MLGHVRRRHAVAQLHLAPRAADLRALERRDQRPGLVAQAPDLGAHRLEHLPHLPVRRPPVLLQPRDLVAHALEVLRDRVQAPLDLLRALPELAGGGRAIRLPLRRRQLLDLLGDLPQRVGGDRLHLLGELLAIAREQRDLLLRRGPQLRELPLSVLGIACRLLAGGLRSKLAHIRPLRLRVPHRSRCASAEPARKHRAPSAPASSPTRNVMTAHRPARSRRDRDLRNGAVACGLPCSLLSLRGEATTRRTVSRRPADPATGLRGAERRGAGSSQAIVSGSPAARRAPRRTGRPISRGIDFTTLAPTAPAAAQTAHSPSPRDDLEGHLAVPVDELVHRLQPELDRHGEVAHRVLERLRADARGVGVERLAVLALGLVARAASARRPPARAWPAGAPSGARRRRSRRPRSCRRCGPRRRGSCSRRP